MRPIRTHGVTTARQEDLDAPIAIARILRRELLHDGHGWRIANRQP
jgi:hypothetical protein